jgi:hypothetical protein
MRQQFRARSRKGTDFAYWIRFKGGQSPTHDGARRNSAFLSAYIRLLGRFSLWLDSLDEAVVHLWPGQI